MDIKFRLKDEVRLLKEEELINIVNSFSDEEISILRPENEDATQCKIKLQVTGKYKSFSTEYLAAILTRYFKEEPKIKFEEEKWFNIDVQEISDKVVYLFDEVLNSFIGKSKERREWVLNLRDVLAQIYYIEPRKYLRKIKVILPKMKDKFIKYEELSDIAKSYDGELADIIIFKLLVIQRMINGESPESLFEQPDEIENSMILKHEPNNYDPRDYYFLGGTVMGWSDDGKKDVPKRVPPVRKSEHFEHLPDINTAIKQKGILTASPLIVVYGENVEIKGLEED